MSQATVPTIDPATEDGVELADHFNKLRDNLYTQHLGAARPAYAVPGMQWLKEISATSWQLMVFDGADDIALGTVDLTANSWTPSGAAMLAVANSFTAAQTVLAAVADLLNLTSTLAGAAQAPNIILRREKGAGVANDFLGSLRAYFRNAANTEKFGGQVLWQLIDATVGSEDTCGSLWSMVAGAALKELEFGNGIALAGAGARMGFGTINASQYYKAGVAIGGGARLSAVRVYTANDTWAKPANLDYIEVEAVGGGGAGGGCSTTNGSLGSGGAAGGYGRKFMLAASLGATVAVTIGAAGAPAAAGASTGGTGGTTSFGAHLSCTGGTGGGSQPNNSGWLLAGNPGVGGTASGGDINLTGQSGNVGWNGSGPATRNVGVGGNSPLGMGGQMLGVNTNGEAGKGYGSGGSGAVVHSDNTARSGGSGAQGVVIVKEYTLS